MTRLADDSMVLRQVSALRTRFVFAVITALVVFLCGLLLIAKDAQANPVGGALGGATKQAEGALRGGDNGGEPSGGRGGGLLDGGLLGGGGGAGDGAEKKEGLAGSLQAVDGITGGMTEGTNDSVLKTAVPAIEGTLETATRPALDEANQIAPRPAALVEETSRSAEEMANPLDEQVGETAQPLLEGATSPISGLTDPVLGTTTAAAAPLVKTVDGLTSPLDEQVGGTVQPLLGGATYPINGLVDTILGTAEPSRLGLPSAGEAVLGGDTLPKLGTATASPFEGAALSPGGSSLGELPALGSSAQPALPGVKPEADSVFEPIVPAFDPTVVGGIAERAALPAIETPPALSSVVPPSSVVEASVGTVLNPLSAAEVAGSYNLVKEPEALLSVGSLGSHLRSLDSALLLLGGPQTAIIGSAASNMALGDQNDAQNPFSSVALPAASSAFGGSGAGISLSLSALAALALLLGLGRVGTLSWSLHESFCSSSYLQLAIERPG